GAEHRAVRALCAPAHCNVPPSQGSLLGAPEPDQGHGTLLESSRSPAPPSRGRALLRRLSQSGMLQQCSSPVSLPIPSNSRIYAGQFFSLIPLVLQVARNRTPSRYTSRTSCRSSVRPAILGSASRIACNPGKSFSSIWPLRAKTVRPLPSNRRIFNIQSYFAIRWPSANVLKDVRL